MMKNIIHCISFFALLLTALLTLTLPAYAVTSQISANFGQGSVVIGPNSNTCNSTTQGALRFTSGSPGTMAYCNNSAWTALGASSGTAAGSNTQVQFNSGGSAFGGAASLTWTNSTNVLAIPNTGTAAVRAGSGTVSLPSHSFSAGTVAGPYLKMRLESVDGAVDLTSFAADDWAQWNTNGTPTNRKSGGGSLIGAATVFGAGTLVPYYDDGRAYSWTDGTPVGTAVGNARTQNCIYNGFNDSGGGLTGSGYTLTFPADTTPRQARIYLGTYGGKATITVSVSDASSSNLVDSSTITAPASNAVFYTAIIDYAAASASQTISVKYVINTANDPYANPTLCAATVKSMSTGSAGTGMWMSAAGTALDFSAAGARALQLGTVASGVNYFRITPGLSQNSPIMTNAGSDTNGTGLGISVTGRAASTAGVGGPVSVTGGDAGITTGYALGAGDIYANAGQGGATGAGGAMAITATNGSSNTGGTVTFSGGASPAANPGNVFGQVSGTTYLTVQSPGTANASVVFNGSDALQLSSGTTGNRPSAGVNGMFRYNTTTSKIEGYQAGAWTSLIGTSVTPNIDALSDAIANYTGTAPLTNSILLGAGAGTGASGTGDVSTSMGYRVLQIPPSSQWSENTAFGALAMTSSQGNYDTAFGSQALYSTTTIGNSRTAFGRKALYSNTGQAGMLGFGANAISIGGSYPCDQDVAAFGYNALNNMYQTCGTQSGFGSRVIENGSINDNTIFVGALAGSGIPNSCCHLAYGATVVGYNAGNFTGTGNVAIGALAFSASYPSTDGGNNTMVGMSAGLAQTTGGQNEFLGYRAGYTTTTGTGNIVIGASQTTATATTSNSINIGGLIKGATDGVGWVYYDYPAHMNYYGPAPAAPNAGCGGATPTVSGNDNVMKVVTGTASSTSACVINFKKAWTNTPICMVTGGTANAKDAYFTAVSTTSMTVAYGVASATAQTLYIICRGWL